MESGNLSTYESKRKGRKMRSCMVNVGNSTVCIDPSVPILHTLGKKHTAAILVVVGNNSSKKNFNEILNDIPFSSSTLISARLKELVDQKLVLRKETEEGVTYQLTPRGEEVRKIMTELFIYFDIK